MTPTLLLYLENNDLIESPAIVHQVFEENGRAVIVLDQTIFYPQGGGQPADRGVIEGEQGAFNVEDVRFVDGIVKHFGTFTRGIFAVGDPVTCFIDEERRALMSRIHSAGHVLDMAVTALGYGWKPGKGFHFPEGPYVEYSGVTQELDKEKIKADIEQRCNEFITQALPVKFSFMEKDKMAEVCNFVPDYLPADKPARVVLFGNYGVPCGGTHVQSLAAIKNMSIRKIKIDGDTIRVSYEVSR